MSRVLRLLVVPVALALLAGLWAGLIRIGWQLPPIQPRLPISHGPLMISGFLGTLIGLERAVALAAGKKRPLDLWPYAAPILSGLGGLLLVIGVSGSIGPLLITLGSVGMVAIFASILRRHMALYTVVMGLGALAWLIGNGLWLFGRPVFTVVLWWAGFLVLTIVGERLELSRVLRLTRNTQIMFGGAVGLFLAGLAAAVVNLDVGVRLAGAGMIALALWLLRFDIARRTVKQTGLTRYIAFCLLAGYVWLGIGGLLAVIFGSYPAGPRYDATLHAIFLGFVFSMIFGHAPIILPALLRLPTPYHPAFYVHLILLHLSLILRIVGDLANWSPGRLWGGMINALALLLFLGSTAWALLKANRTKSTNRT